MSANSDLNPINPSEIAGIILAAGASLRFGSPKQMARWRNTTLLQRAMDVSSASRLHRIILVLGYRADIIRRHIGSHLDSHRIQWVLNPRYQKGQSESVKSGLQCVHERYDAVMFLMADQPLVNTRMIDRLIKTFSRSEKEICVPTYKGRRGTPVIIGSRFYPELFQITGDKGAREIIKGNSDHVISLEMEDPACLADVDTITDLSDLADKTTHS